MKRAIVTGATGMIASALIRTLVEKNVEVYALCRPGDPKTDEFFENPLVTAIDADISEFSAVRGKIDKKCDVLYHFAWLGTFGGTRNDAYIQNDNIKYTLDAVKLAYDTGCECFVSAGSQAEYGRVTEKLTGTTYADPETGYGIAKYTAGKFSRMYAHQLGLRHCWVRILSVFGQKGNPNSIIMSSLDKMLRGEYTSYTKGEQQWDFLHCDDAALAFYLIGEKGKDGKPYPAGPNWGTFYAIDFYNKEAAAYIKKVFDVVLNEWGYDMVKLDFLYAACVAPMHGKTRGRIMCEAMDFIRECVGDKMILGCGVPLMPAFGKVDFCRIGADVALDWHFRKHMIREDVSTPNTVCCTIFRRGLNGRAFLNDPDVFMLRDKNMRMSFEKRRLLAKINGMFGDLLFVSDNVSEYGAEQREVFFDTVRKKNVRVLRAGISDGDIMRVDYEEEGEKKSFSFNYKTGVEL